jgi:hypothetical protein
VFRGHDQSLYNGAKSIARSQEAAQRGNENNRRQININKRKNVKGIKIKISQKEKKE